MTEKRFKCCGLCSHFGIGEWNGSKGLFDHYCDVINKNVSIIGYACPDFKRRVDKTEETKWEVTEVIKRS
jgi:hypothetical protein